MANELATVSIEFAPVKWTAKTAKGDVVRTAYCATSEAFAPKAARLAAAQQKDLAQLMNGQYRPVLAAVSSKMNDREKVKLFEAGISVSREKPTKTEMVPFCDAVCKLWAPAKGEKAAIAAMLKLFAEQATESTTAPAPQDA